MNNSCHYCKNLFTNTESEITLYNLISPEINKRKFTIPLPKFCSDCRTRRMLSFRNEKALFQRTCDLTKKNIISMYPQNTIFPVYHQDEWWGDEWDASIYGMEFNFSQTLFDQIHELMKIVPRKSLVELFNENSKYTNWVDECKNCYLIYSSSKCEDCLYSSLLTECKDCVDCLELHNCELCYECTECSHLYESSYCLKVNNSHDCMFCYECRNLKNCFLCTNLNSKEYYFLNKKYSKNEYLSKIDKVLSSREYRNKCLQKFHEILSQSIHRSINNVFCENCIGNNLEHCKNCINCFNSEYLDNCFNTICSSQAKNSLDLYATVQGTEKSLSIFSCTTNTYNCLFCFGMWKNCSFNIYCQELHACSHCFGCIGLKQKKYCILNKQYSKDEYNKLLPKIMEHITNTGEWGEFFPSSLSPFYYMDTIAGEYYPITYSEAKLQGLKWKIDEDKKMNTLLSEVVVPDKISDTDESIINKTINCKKTQEVYKIILQEYKFYKKMNIALPEECSKERHMRRLRLRNTRKLYNKKCDKCEKDMKTTYSPNSPEIIYCEECYFKEVY